MGRKIIKSVASELLSQSTANGVTSDDLEEDGIELLETEASFHYLCNLAPHRYQKQINKHITFHTIRGKNEVRLQNFLSYLFFLYSFLLFWFTYLGSLFLMVRLSLQMPNQF